MMRKVRGKYRMRKQEPIKANKRKVKVLPKTVHPKKLIRENADLKAQVVALEETRHGLTLCVKDLLRIIGALTCEEIVAPDGESIQH